jgi:hypothetical protein
MADPILTEFVKQTLNYQIPGLDPQDPKEALEEILKTEKSERTNTTEGDEPPEIRVNTLGQTVKIHY